MTHSLSQRTKEFNRLLIAWQNFYDVPLGRLVNHLYDLGYSMNKVAQIMDFSPSIILKRFPKKEEVQ